MSTSPRTMWSGTIELGLINIPITLGKATADSRESGLTQVCRCHKLPIDRTWRCAESGHAPEGILNAVQVEEGVWREITEAEMVGIEEATKSKTLTVLDVQPLAKLPMLYSVQCYYARHDDKSKMAPTAMATLVAAMTQKKVGIVVKWGGASKEKLCILTAESGMLVMRVIPFLDDVRVASKKEREHFRVKVQPANVVKLGELLDAIREPEGFDYSVYRDEAYILRQAAVDRILAGEKPEPVESTPRAEPIDISTLIDSAIEAQKGSKQNV